MTNELTRPIVGIENRTAQEVFDIMVNRIRLASQPPQEHMVGPYRPTYQQIKDAVQANINRMHDAGESHLTMARWLSADLDKLYPPLIADFTKALPDGSLDDSDFSAIEEALDKADAPCRADDGRWLTLPERITALSPSPETRGRGIEASENGGDS